MEKLHPASLVYVDESGLDESIQREYARTPIGQRASGEVSGKRAARTSIIAGLSEGELIAPFHFQGYCNTEVILVWVKEVLLPLLKSGMTVIWDNASFHKSPKIKALIEAVGCTLLFLPPYSPDLNPIEHWWATLKAWIRKIRLPGMTLEQTLTQVFQDSNKIMN